MKPHVALGFYSTVSTVQHERIEVFGRGRTSEMYFKKLHYSQNPKLANTLSESQDAFLTSVQEIRPAC